ncbi:MAG: chemotaxis protein CheW [Phycisphaerales bacterium]|nr:chemotaxis protein CheW [Phycisphaerales bacterium]
MTPATASTQTDPVAELPTMSGETSAVVTENTTRYVVVEINSNMYGITTDATVELMDSDTIQITRVSHSPNFVRGVINHRGSIIPAIDMWTLLGFDRGHAAHAENSISEQRAHELNDEPVSTSMMVITEFGTQKIGLIVDGVHAVFDCTDDQVEPLPESAENAAFLKGLVHQDDGSYILITDIERIYQKACPN